MIGIVSLIYSACVRLGIGIVGMELGNWWGLS